MAWGDSKLRSKYFFCYTSLKWADSTKSEQKVSKIWAPTYEATWYSWIWWLVLITLPNWRNQGYTKSFAHVCEWLSASSLSCTTFLPAFECWESTEHHDVVLVTLFCSFVLLSGAWGELVRVLVCRHKYFTLYQPMVSVYFNVKMKRVAILITI